jgi:2-polyprenyl-3-methyl-5-hydroxy-6-metoxy-1,4-benzoquinol methylase
MNSNSSNAANITCLICGNNSEIIQTGLFDTRFGIHAVYSIARCAACGLEQTTPLPSSDEIKSLYEAYYNFGGESGTPYAFLRSLFLSSLFYRFWMLIDGDISFHSKRGNGRLLDVGCNEGRGLELYAGNGFIAEGLELNEAAAEVARLRGLMVHKHLIEDFVPAVPYDVVVLSNVLEHSLNPVDMLNHVNRLLRPGGELWISCPNNLSWLRSAFGRYWINWHVPFHVTHFSADTLSELLQNTGFKTRTVHHRTPALWVAHSVISRIFARHDQPTEKLRNPLLVVFLMLMIRGTLFPFLWFGNRLGRGDCLTVVAGKR